jgi:hypothetical protein
MPTAKIPRISAQRWLEELLSLFPPEPDSAPGTDWESSTAARLELIAGSEVPEPYATLLVHDHHMTAALEEHYGQNLSLELLAVRQRGEDYARKLLLRAGAGGPVALAGIMRFLLQHCGETVRREIVEGRRPLGRILVEYDVMRHVQSVAFLKVGLEGELGRLFGESASDATATRSGYTYGRLAVLFCNEEPAVELLEIVAPTEVRG